VLRNEFQDTRKKEQGGLVGVRNGSTFAPALNARRRCKQRGEGEKKEEWGLPELKNEVSLSPRLRETFWTEGFNSDRSSLK
jgi:hypothetical protein